KPKSDVVKPRGSWRMARWWAPALALLAIAVALSGRPSTSSTNSLASQFAELAVSNHRDLERGVLALDIHSESQQTLNEWLRLKSPFFVALPGPPNTLAGVPAFDLEGARLVRLGDATAMFIAYRATMPRLALRQMQPAIATLTVIPSSVVKASGGAEANFPTVRFHYTIVEGYKVVTCSQH